MYYIWNETISMSTQMAKFAYFDTYFFVRKYF